MGSEPGSEEQSFVWCLSSGLGRAWTVFSQPFVRKNNLVSVADTSNIALQFCNILKFC